MQMSIERFREVHKYIWNYVIEHATEIEAGVHSLGFFKREGLNCAYHDKGYLDFDETICIQDNFDCLLCASRMCCRDCILESCFVENSLYRRACRGDVQAMKEIRDVVDKWPYTEFSIITLRY